MRILVLKSSGNRNGSSNTLADAFIRGAQESGHMITEYETAIELISAASPMLSREPA